MKQINFMPTSNQKLYSDKNGFSQIYFVSVVSKNFSNENIRMFINFDANINCIWKKS